MGERRITYPVIPIKLTLCPWEDSRAAAFSGVDDVSLHMLRASCGWLSIKQNQVHGESVWAEGTRSKSHCHKNRNLMWIKVFF